MEQTTPNSWQSVEPSEYFLDSAAGEYLKAHNTRNGASSASNNYARPDEDWTTISDLAERRRIQNRIAQRNYRKKLKTRLEDLEKRAASSTAKPPMQAELNDGSSEWPQHSKGRGPDRIVIGIDYGTTYTGLAWAKSESDDTKLNAFQVVDSWGSRSRSTDSNNTVPKNPYSTRDLQWGADLSPDAVTMIRTKLERDAQAPFWKRAYMKATDYKRKAVQVVLNGKTYFARPDSGSDRNIMTEAFARDCGAIVHRGKDDTGLFKVGTGNCIQSIGRALVPLKLPNGGESGESLWFHILPKCPVPLIMGAEFLRKIHLFTRNKHLLVECPFNFGSFPTFKWIGSPQGELSFFANGQLLTGSADTGSDLDLISLDCALANGFEIDRRHRSRTRVMLADESIVETVGQVHMSSVQLPGFSDFEMSFHVLPDLVCDVIFGEEFLEQMDAYNTCNIVDSTDPFSPYSLNPFINLGPLQSFLNRRSTTKTSEPSTMLEQHDSDIEAEFYRRNKANRIILKMKDEFRAEQEKIAEEKRRRAFDLKHVRCIHCSGSRVPPIHQPKAIEAPGRVSVRVVS